MKTAELFANQFIRVTTEDKAKCRPALYILEKGITLEAVKGVMSLEGFGDASRAYNDNYNDFIDDVANKYVKRVHYWAGDMFRPTVKGCKAIFNLLNK